MQRFTANGTWTAPATIDHVLVELVGGGGAGGGGTIEPPLAGGIGGGGAYTKAFLSVTPGETYSVVVGTGGVGIDGALGNTGGESKFLDDGNNILAFANGGSGGNIITIPGIGGTTTGNTALYASPGIVGSSGNGVPLVFNGIGYGAGGGGGAADTTDAGSTGGNGVVLVWW